jgi:hypothetical protein
LSFFSSSSNYLHRAPFSESRPRPASATGTTLLSPAF